MACLSQSAPRACYVLLDEGTPVHPCLWALPLMLDVTGARLLCPSPPWMQAGPADPTEFFQVGEVPQALQRQSSL